MNRYDAILFDFDGVLADTEPVHFDCWREVLTPHGINLTWPIYAESCIGVHDEEMLNFLRTLARPIVALEVVWCEFARKKDLFRQKVADQSPIPAATVELVRSLKEFKLAVVSSSGRCEIEPMLMRAQLLNHFDAVVFGDDVSQFKPHPEPYLKAAAILGASNPLVVEDSEAGAASGRSAGYEVLRLDHPANLTATLISHGIFSAVHDF